MIDNDIILTQLEKGDIRALSRLLTYVENRSPVLKSLYSPLYKKGGKAQVIGVTGSPGAGKSTLVDVLAMEYVKQGKKVAILAIDPTSPFTGGAILGDRIRMVHSGEVEGVFIRSMASRGATGGLSRSTFEAVSILDAAGFEVIFLETVGVGQVELDVVKAVDSCIVVVVPGMGDAVQTFKAGILEIADLFVINKAEREGADLLHRDLKLLISLGQYSEGAWEPSISRTVASQGEGIREVVQQLDHHYQWLQTSKEGVRRRAQAVRFTLLNLFNNAVLEELFSEHAQEFEKLVSECTSRTKDPLTALEELLQSRKGSLRTETEVKLS